MEAVSQYVIDTVAFARYLRDDLPRRADQVMREAESGRSHVLLPQIALAEFICIALRGRLRGAGLRTTLREVIHNLLASPAFSVSAMPNSGWEILPELQISESHCRMIAAEAIARKLPLITNDSRLRAVPVLRVVW